MMTTTVAAPATPSPAEKAQVKRSWTQHGLLFVIPFLLIYVAFLVWPTLLGLRMSFTDANIAGSNDRYVALANSAEAFADPRMLRSLWSSLVLPVLGAVPLVILPLALAALVPHLRFLQWL